MARLVQPGLREAIQGPQHAGGPEIDAVKDVGIVVLGGLLVLGLSGDGTLNKILLVIAIAFGTINVVGGFLVTDRMLGMFKSRPEKPAAGDGAVARAGGADAKASGNGREG